MEKPLAQKALLDSAEAYLNSYQDLDWLGVAFYLQYKVLGLILWVGKIDAHLSLWFERYWESSQPLLGSSCQELE